MRAIAALAILAIIAPFSAALHCPATPTLDPYAPSSCAGFMTCDTALCGCLGANGTIAAMCFASAPSATTCDTASTCAASYFQCLTALDNSRTNMTDPCYNFGQTMHQAILASIVSGYAGSQLQQSCESNLCRVSNTSSRLAVCNYGGDEGVKVCNNVTSTAAPITTPAPTVIYDIVAAIRLSGANWSNVLNDPVAYATLVVDLQTDLAALLGIPAADIVILSLTSGSLLVNFAVIQGSGKSIAQLSSGVSSATSSTTWLASVAAVYAASGGTDSIVVTSAAVTQTAAPTTAAPGSNVPSVGSAPVTTVFAAFAVAVVALLF